MFNIFEGLLTLGILLWLAAMMYMRYKRVGLTEVIKEIKDGVNK